MREHSLCLPVYSFIARFPKITEQKKTLFFFVNVGGKGKNFLLLTKHLPMIL